MTDITFFNPNEMPYGILSNYAAYPFVTKTQNVQGIMVPKEEYKSVSHYVYGEISKSCHAQKLIMRSKNNELISNFSYQNYLCQKRIFEKCLNKFVEGLVRQNDSFRKFLLMSEGKKLNFKLSTGKDKDSMKTYEFIESITKNIKKFVENSKDVKLVNNFSFYTILNELIQNGTILNIFEKVKYNSLLAQRQIMDYKNLEIKNNIIFNTFRILYILYDTMVNELDVDFDLLKTTDFNDLIDGMEPLYALYDLNYSNIIEKYHYQSLGFFDIISKFVDNKINLRELLEKFVYKVKQDFEIKVEQKIKSILFDGYIISKLLKFNKDQELNSSQMLDLFNSIKNKFLTNKHTSNQTINNFVSIINNSSDTIYKLYKDNKLKDIENYQMFDSNGKLIDIIPIIDKWEKLRQDFNTNYTEFISQEPPEKVFSDDPISLSKNEKSSVKESDVLSTVSSGSSDSSGILPPVDKTEPSAELEKALDENNPKKPIISTQLKPAGGFRKKNFVKSSEEFTKGEFVKITGDLEHLTPGRVEEINEDGTIRVLYSYSDELTDEQKEKQTMNFKKESLLKIYEKADKIFQKNINIVLDPLHLFKNYFNCRTNPVDDPFYNTEQIEEELDFLKIFDENINIDGNMYCDFLSYYYHALYFNYFNEDVIMKFEHRYFKTDQFGPNANMWYTKNINGDFNTLRLELAKVAIKNKFKNFKNKSLLLSTKSKSQLFYTDQQDKWFGYDEKNIKYSNQIGKYLMQIRNDLFKQQYIQVSVFEELLQQYSVSSITSKTDNPALTRQKYIQSLQDNKLFKWIFDSRIRDLIMTCKCLELEINYTNLNTILKTIFYPCRFLDINFLYDIKMEDSFKMYVNIILSECNVKSTISIEVYQLLYTFASNMVFNLYKESYSKEYLSMVNILERKQNNLSNRVYYPQIIIDSEKFNKDDNISVINTILHSLINLTNLIHKGFDKPVRKAIIYSYKIITKQYITKVKRLLEETEVPSDISINYSSFKKLRKLLNGNENKQLLLQCVFSIYNNMDTMTTNRINFMFNNLKNISFDLSEYTELEPTFESDDEYIEGEEVFTDEEADN